jgi:hypothetical protein
MSIHRARKGRMPDKFAEQGCEHRHVTQPTQIPCQRQGDAK